MTADTKAKWAVLALIGAMLVCAVMAVANAQEGIILAPGEKYVIDWTQELVCTNGAPITECPIGGYYVQIEREQSRTVWNNVSTSPYGPTIRAYTWTANGSGQTCFRVQVLNSALYDPSPPSNIHCVKVVVPLKPGTKPPVASGHKLETP